MFSRPQGLPGVILTRGRAKGSLLRKVTEEETAETDRHESIRSGVADSLLDDIQEERARHSSVFSSKLQRERKRRSTVLEEQRRKTMDEVTAEQTRRTQETERQRQQEEQEREMKAKEETYIARIAELERQLQEERRKAHDNDKATQTTFPEPQTADTQPDTVEAEERHAAELRALEKEQTHLQHTLIHERDQHREALKALQADFDRQLENERKRCHANLQHQAAFYERRMHRLEGRIAHLQKQLPLCGAPPSSGSVDSPPPEPAASLLDGHVCTMALDAPIPQRPANNRKSVPSASLGGRNEPEKPSPCQSPPTRTFQPEGGSRPSLSDKSKTQELQAIRPAPPARSSTAVGPETSQKGHHHPSMERHLYRLDLPSLRPKQESDTATDTPLLEAERTQGEQPAASHQHQETADAEMSASASAERTEEPSAGMSSVGDPHVRGDILALPVDPTALASKQDESTVAMEPSPPSLSAKQHHEMAAVELPVHGDLVVDYPYDAIAEPTELKRRLRHALAKAVAIEVDRINVIDLLPGSVIVRVEISPSSGGRKSSDVLSTLQQQIKDKQSALYQHVRSLLMDSSSRTQRRYMLAAELPILRPSNSSHDAGTSLRSQSLPAPAATGGPARAALAASPPKRTDSFPTARITPVPGTIYMRTQPGRIARVFLKRVRPNVATDDAKMVDKTRGEKQDEADAQRDDQGEEESPLRRNGGRQGSRTPPQAQQSQPQTPLQAEPRHVTTHKGRETVPEAARPQTDIFPTTSLQNALDELMAKEQEGNEGEKAILASHPPASSIEETHIALAADLEIQRFLSRRQLDESSMEQLQDIRERLQTMKREGEAWLAVGNSQGGIDE
ncbi:unnamed protein product [Vitrella brassicaformis CCMP3155]|uniref:Uncharacterized protein n=2 Tax=Vitrella brassicaformis TaxID=1169539 RepID=A0A0G4H5V5_VITBC|nr:unnamed protein product [Vitrella brassicaformis CCMP3155]|eukprot:CEM39227.1 unnamed protein product [Vitrella brassicaformis CCMP3155]